MLIKLNEYERIYKIINTLVVNEGGNAAYACILFSAFGSYVLEKHYKIRAEPKAGLAAYHVGADNDAIVFGEFDQNGILTGQANSFHCWLEAEGWLIDFMAPAFPELYKKPGKSFFIPPYMLQKPLSKMASSAEALRNPGDFYLESDPITTINRMSILSSSQAYSDLAEICVNWYKKPPQKIPKTIQIYDQNGKNISTALIGKTVTGAW